MIVLDRPFASDFLLTSLQKNNFPVIDTEQARAAAGAAPLNWISPDEARSRFSTDPDTLLYTNSENSIGWIENNLPAPGLVRRIKACKDKLLFRNMLAGAFPGFYFKGAGLSGLRSMDVSDIPFPCVVKPATGFFSIGVHKIDRPEEWNDALDCIEQEITRTRAMYPKEVLDTGTFIIEECIDGEEYAVDCYFDTQGKPVILNIMHHMFSSGKDVSDRVYTTSKDIIEQNRDRIMDFLVLLSKKGDLRNFPAHVEIRIDTAGRVQPVEVNPLRFGGFCTTGDLSWYAWGINSYEYFFRQEQPEWDQIFASRKEKQYSIIVLDNNSGIAEQDIASFDYDLLLSDFTKPLSLRKIDFRAYAVFGFLFIETDKGHETEIQDILRSDLKKYITTA